VNVRAALNISTRIISGRKVVMTTFQPKQVIRLATEFMLKEVGVVKAPIKDAKRYNPYVNTSRKRARIAAIEVDADLMKAKDKDEDRTMITVSHVQDQPVNRDKEMTSVE
jgi:hypothetical protein